MGSIKELLRTCQPASSGSWGAVEELLTASDSLAVQAAQQAAAALKALNTASAGSNNPDVKLLKKKLRDLVLWRVFGVNGAIFIDKGTREKQPVLDSLNCTDVCKGLHPSVVHEMLSQLIQADGKIQQCLLKQLICSSNWASLLKELRRNPDELENAAALHVLQTYVRDVSVEERSPCSQAPSIEKAATIPDTTSNISRLPRADLQKISISMPPPMTLNTFLHYPNPQEDAVLGSRRRCASEGAETRSSNSEYLYLQEVILDEEYNPTAVTQQTFLQRSQTVHNHHTSTASSNGIAQEAWFELKVERSAQFGCDLRQLCSHKPSYCRRNACPCQSHGVFGK
jgi:hypothetical protein